MSNKEYHRYRAKVRKKLLEIGIKDESIPVVSAKKSTWVRNPETGAIELKQIPKYSLQNLNRRMVNQMVQRNSDIQTIESFLATDSNMLKQAAPEVAEHLVKQDESQKL